MPINSTIRHCYFGFKDVRKYIDPHEEHVSAIANDMKELLNRKGDLVMISVLTRDVHKMFPYKAEEGYRDHWKTPKESFKDHSDIIAGKVPKDRASDCEDTAIIVASVLANINYPYQLVIGEYLLNGEYVGHAWTETKSDGKYYILESTVGRVFEREPMYKDRRYVGSNFVSGKNCSGSVGSLI